MPIIQQAFLVNKQPFVAFLSKQKSTENIRALIFVLAVHTTAHAVAHAVCKTHVATAVACAGRYTCVYRLTLC